MCGRIQFSLRNEVSLMKMLGISTGRTMEEIAAPSADLPKPFFVELGKRAKNFTTDFFNHFDDRKFWSVFIE